MSVLHRASQLELHRLGNDPRDSKDQWWNQLLVYPAAKQMRRRESNVVAMVGVNRVVVEGRARKTGRQEEREEIKKEK
jgi:hypothetical protein